MAWLAPVTKAVGGITAALFAISVLMGIGAGLYADHPDLCTPADPDCVGESAAYFSTFATMTMFAAMASIVLIVAHTIQHIRRTP